ncbi:MAG: V-type ATP synthase subunit I [Promethearchaeota archaeon]|jgi:V/A-type H+-transporting ATPase subunit I
MTHKNDMCLFKVIINPNYKDDLLNRLSVINNVHIMSKEGYLIKIKLIEKDPFLNILKNLRQDLNNLFNKIRVSESSFQELKKIDKEGRIEFLVDDIRELINSVGEEITFYLNRINELDRYIAKAKIELENIQLIKTGYTFLEQFNLNRNSLSSLKELDFRVFTTFTKNLENLESLFEFSSLPNVHQTDELFPNVYKIEDRNVFYIISPEEKGDELNERLKLIHAEEVPILKKYLTNEGINFTRIESEINIIEDTLSKYEKERQRLRDNNLQKFAAIHEIVQNIEEYHWAEKQFEQISHDRVSLRFFIPVRIKKEVEQDLISYFKDKIMFETIDIPKHKAIKKLEAKKPNQKEILNAKELRDGKGELEVDLGESDVRSNTPTIMRNNWFIRPFETLTRMYGTPAYSEIDPTPFLAITFPLLFGLMFGDIGHGLCLVIAGIIGRIFLGKRGQGIRNFSWIIFYCGLGAILGGFLYGEFFGSEYMFGIHLPKIPFMVPLLGSVSLHDPINNIITIFMFTLFVGVVHIDLGWIIEFVNYWKQSKKYLSITDSFIKICFITGGAILIFQYGINLEVWLSSPYPILYVIVPGLLLIILRPLGGLFGISYLKEESFGALMGEGSVKTFETVLSVLSNVASYIRLLALSLVHIALMVTIQTMVGMIEGGGIIEEIFRVVGLIFGNLVVILLEGILVFINAIRLHFYEFFFKFYQGTGTEFFPFYLDEDYSIINFRKEISKDIISEEIEKEMETEKTKEVIDEAIKIIEDKFFR